MSLDSSAITNYSISITIISINVLLLISVEWEHNYRLTSFFDMITCFIHCRLTHLDTETVKVRLQIMH